MDRYAVVDSTGLVINVVLWDGINSWKPGEGLIAIKDDNVNRFDTYDFEKKIFTRQIIATDNIDS